MAMNGEKYTALKCKHDIEKHELLRNVHGTQYNEVIHEAGKLLHNANAQ